MGGRRVGVGRTEEVRKGRGKGEEEGDRKRGRERGGGKEEGMRGVLQPSLKVLYSSVHHLGPFKSK